MIYEAAAVAISKDPENEKEIMAVFNPQKNINKQKFEIVSFGLIPIMGISSFWIFAERSSSSKIQNEVA